MHAGDPDTCVLLHRKTYYPEDAYRLPTGGVHVGERVADTLVRGIFEETGLVVGEAENQVRVERFLGVLVYDMLHTGLGRNVPFATYHFLVRMPPEGELDPQDPEESIAGWKWCPAQELLQVAAALEQVYLRSATWADWGRFRALSHRFVAETLIPS